MKKKKKMGSEYFIYIIMKISVWSESRFREQTEHILILLLIIVTRMD